MAAVPGLVLCCEHASKHVPRRYARLFAGNARLLDSHRGWDPGALELARSLARETGAPLFRGVCTRLLVDLNRSLGSPTLFVGRAASLPEDERLALLARYWAPYRRAVRRRLRRELEARPRVLHLSVHTFAPRLRGEARSTDVGLLFDPRRPREAAFSRTFAAALARELPALRIHANRPYSGVGDGLTASLRAELPPARYLGIELEVNQRFPRAGRAAWRRLEKAVARALLSSLP
jgi:predicted N-formylglutamate amidohydrolase